MFTMVRSKLSKHVLYFGVFVSVMGAALSVAPKEAHAEMRGKSRFSPTINNVIDNGMDMIPSKLAKSKTLRLTIATR